jgi:toxin ParE1/3/4
LEVLVYTIQNWGQDQAQIYLQGLEQTFEMLSLNPSIGRKVDLVSGDYRVFSYQKQAIFYRKTQVLEIVRIINQNRDYMAILDI